MPLTAKQLKYDRKDQGKDQGKNSRHEKVIPFRQPLQSRQWKPDEWFDPSVQETNLCFDRMPPTPINASGCGENRGYENHLHYLSGASSA
jgi:hypothetical protein